MARALKTDGSTRLFVGNLGDDAAVYDGNITPGDLRPLFEKYGTVTECECIRNFAYVIFV